MFEFWSPSPRTSTDSTRTTPPSSPSSKVPPIVTLGHDNFSLLATLQTALTSPRSSSSDSSRNSSIFPPSPTTPPIGISGPLGLHPPRKAAATLPPTLRAQGKLTLTFALRHHGGAFSNEARIEAANRIEGAIAAAGRRGKKGGKGVIGGKGGMGMGMGGVGRGYGEEDRGDRATRAQWEYRERIYRIGGLLLEREGLVADVVERRVEPGEVVGM
ncbi:hypothetical protein EDC01DRAFT_635401 [Geopyxis carbonaria]|nr:hypothetical protein EDC01DRAFT_635401 [Geopyxis carbonaria]